MFFAALFVIVKDWKKSKCPSLGYQLNIFLHIHTMKSYAVSKINEVDPNDLVPKTPVGC